MVSMVVTPGIICCCSVHTSNNAKLASRSSEYQFLPVDVLVTQQCAKDNFINVTGLSSLFLNIEAPAVGVSICCDGKGMICFYPQKFDRLIDTADDRWGL